MREGLTEILNILYSTIFFSGSGRGDVLWEYLSFSPSLLAQAPLPCGSGALALLSRPPGPGALTPYHLSLDPLVPLGPRPSFLEDLWLRGSLAQRPSSPSSLSQAASALKKISRYKSRYLY